MYENGLERQAHEAAALAGLNDRRIIPAAAAGGEDGGESLKARLARGALSETEAIGIAIELASILEKPHRLGIVHGGLTAESVWLGPEGSVHLLNFGSATGDYSNVPLDPRADLYDAGRVLEAMRTPALRRAARRCRERNPNQRFQSAGALREELERVREKAARGGFRPPAKQVLALAGAVVVIAGIATWRVAMRAPAGPPPAPQLSFRQATYSADIVSAALSPDGRYLAAVHRDADGDSLYLRALEGNREEQIVAPGNGCCADPSIAPDDGEVVFLGGGKLEAVARGGGVVRTLAAGAESGAGFSPSGRRISYVAGGALMTAEGDGSRSSVLLPSGFAPVTPAWSPDGEHIAAVRGQALEVIALADDSVRALPDRRGAPLGGVTSLAWLPSGRGLIVTAGKQVWQIAWPGGERSQLTNSSDGYTHASVALDGMLAVLHGAPEASLWAQKMPRGPLVEMPGGQMTRNGANGVAWTATGEIITTRVFHHDHQFWIENPARSTAAPIPLKGPEGTLLAPVVAPDGMLVFQVRDGGKTRLWRARMDGSDAAPLASGDPDAAFWQKHRSGMVSAFIQRQGSVENIWAQMPGGGAPRELTHFQEQGIFSFAFARDGRLALSRGSQNTNVWLASGIPPRKH
ncbi:MAG: hypothetical protein ACRD1Y_13510 [Terriglobales bacterium]